MNAADLAAALERDCHGDGYDHDRVVKDVDLLLEAARALREVAEAQQAERLCEPAHKIASLAVAYAEAHDAAHAAGDAWRAGVRNSDLWSRVRFTETALREAARALLGNVRLRKTSDVEVRAENARLREQIRVLREELTTARLGAERRNRDLDALHLVWCNGGCNSGVHRYCGSREEITEEVVALAEHHVKRLREWFQSYKFKNRSKEAT